MPETTARSSWKKKILLVTGGLIGFLLLFVVAIRITVSELFHGIAAERATGLSAEAGWDLRSMWTSPFGYQRSVPYGAPVDADKASWIARSAELQIRSSAFEQSVSQLHRIVGRHHGYLEDLRTESRTGSGRALAATISVPTEEFDNTLSDLQTLGRIEVVSQEGEDSAVKLATATRHVDAAKTNLMRLQKLQRERKGELRDAVALEKDIARANEAVAEAERQHDGLISTVEQAHFRVALLEDYRAPLQANVAGASLQIRNAFVEGVTTIWSSICTVLGVLLGYGLPLVFWMGLLFWPVRLAWRRWRRAPASAAVTA